MISFQIIVFLFVAKFGFIVSLGPPAGPAGQIDILNFRACKTNAKPSIAINFNFDYNKKVLNGNISLPFNFDNTLMAKGLFDKWTGSEWKKNVMKFDGNACDLLNKYIKRIWTNFLNKMEPKVKGTCLVKKGNYILNNLEAKPKDLTPSIVYGKIKGQITVTKGKDIVMCIEGTGDAKY